MSTFYRGYKQRNKVLEDYFQGYVTENGEKIPLKQRMSKYNIEFLQRVNNLNAEFYSIIIGEQVAIKLMNLNSNCNQGEMYNLWNLIKSQGGTIRYNKIMKKALKKFIIDNKTVYMNIKKDIEKEEDRVVRNIKLVMELLMDYGLSDIIELVEQENKKTFFEHIKDYTDEIGKNINYGTNNDDDEDIKKYYEEIQNAYIEYLKDLANKNGISLDNNISDKLELHRQIKKERQEAAKEARKVSRDNNKKNNAIASMDRDNILINADINSSYDVPKKKIIDKAILYNLYTRINNNNGIIYYISLCKSKKVGYMSNNKGITYSICNARFFLYKEYADEALRLVQDNTQYKGYNITVQCLTTSKYNPNIERKPEDKTEIYIDSSKIANILNDTDISYGEIKLIKDFILREHGYYGNSAETEIVFCQVQYNGVSNTRETNSGKLIKIENGAIKLVKNYASATAFTDEEIESTGLMPKLKEKLGRNYEVNKLKVKINSSWYRKKLDEILKEHQEVLTKIKEDTNLKNKIDSYRNSGYPTIYYLIEKSDRSDSTVFYGTNVIRNKHAKLTDLTILKFFTDINEAYKVLKKVYEKGGSSVVRVLAIEL